MKAIVAALLTISVTGSWAGLGSAPATFGTGVLSAQTRIQSTGPAAYSDVETKLESGVVIHEYVDANGTVFAVSWSGPFLPDLKEILGRHFSAMVANAGGEPKAGRSQLSVKQSDLVIVSGGHMGAFEGQAWLPAKLPAGFNPSDIQ